MGDETDGEYTRHVNGEVIVVTHERSVPHQTLDPDSDEVVELDMDREVARVSREHVVGASKMLQEFLVETSERATDPPHEGKSVTQQMDEAYDR